MTASLRATATTAFSLQALGDLLASAFQRRLAFVARQHGARGLVERAPDVRIAGRCGEGHQRLCNCLQSPRNIAIRPLPGHRRRTVPSPRSAQPALQRAPSPSPSVASAAGSRRRRRTMCPSVTASGRVSGEAAVRHAPITSGVYGSGPCAATPTLRHAQLSPKAIRTAIAHCDRPKSNSARIARRTAERDPLDPRADGRRRTRRRCFGAGLAPISEPPEPAINRDASVQERSMEASGTASSGA